MPTTIKQDIMAAIGRTDDPTMKAVLLLLLGVLEEIGGKIDAMRADEVGLREAVLNGHAEDHNKHHEWIAKQIESDCADVCDWARNKKAEEEEAAKEARIDRRSARDAAIRQVVTILCSFAAGIAGVLWMIK